MSRENAEKNQEVVHGVNRKQGKVSVLGGGGGREFLVTVGCSL